MGDLIPMRAACTFWERSGEPGTVGPGFFEVRPICYCQSCLPHNPSGAVGMIRATCHETMDGVTVWIYDAKAFDILMDAATTPDDDTGAPGA